MRFEVKSSYPPFFDGDVVAWVKAHCMAFRVPYPTRRINNVYFDTMDMHAMAENIAGISRRCKMRYRWYGDAELPQPGVLEFKNKHAALGWKDNFRLPDLRMEPGDTWRVFARALREQLPPEGRMMLDTHGEPALINRYVRRYFVSRDDRLRITLDSDQWMYDQSRSMRPNTRRSLNLPPVNVLELKCEAIDREELVRALADCPVRISRFSKYTAGSDLR